jgi:hypothetical protein
MNFKNIKLKKQHVTKSMIQEALHICYDNISFSTFPYIVYGLQSSDHTIKSYNSGNCIGLSLFLKKYFKNIGLVSHLIPASVPSIHMVPGVNHICHVSLLIPYDKDKFYIIDPAFYFLEPLDCQIGNNIERVIDSANIHNDTITPIYYKLSGADKYNEQDLQCTCYFKEDPDDVWHYYVQEVSLEYADAIIGNTFMTKKPEPFIVKTTFDIESGMVKKAYHIKKLSSSDCVIIKGRDEIYSGPINKVPKAILKEIYMKLYKYFSKNIF